MALSTMRILSQHHMQPKSSWQQVSGRGQEMAASTGATSPRRATARMPSGTSHHQTSLFCLPSSPPLPDECQFPNFREDDQNPLCLWGKGHIGRSASDCTLTSDPEDIESKASSRSSVKINVRDRCMCKQTSRLPLPPSLSHKCTQSHSPSCMPHLLASLGVVALRAVLTELAKSSPTISQQANGTLGGQLYSLEKDVSIR